MSSSGRTGPAIASAFFFFFLNFVCMCCDYVMLFCQKALICKLNWLRGWQVANAAYEKTSSS